jgi:hypothetical protein
MGDARHAQPNGVVAKRASLAARPQFPPALRAAPEFAELRGEFIGCSISHDFSFQVEKAG